MTKIVLIALDRVGLARLSETLQLAGYQVEASTMLADAEILIHTTSADLLIVDVDDRMSDDLHELMPLAQINPDLEVVLILGPMTPAAEQGIIETTMEMGVSVHLPRQLTKTPFFISVMNVIADRHHMRGDSVDDQSVIQPTVRSTNGHTAPKADVILDYDILREQLYQELNAGFGLSLMLMGINEFDEIVQKRGEHAAEQLVQELGELIRNDLRDTDLVAHTQTRERLAVLLPMTEAVQAKIVASRIQVKMARRALGTVSLSAGIVEAQPGMSVDDMLYHAENAWRQSLDRDENLLVLQ